MANSFINIGNSFEIPTLSLGKILVPGGVVGLSTEEYNTYREEISINPHLYVCSGTNTGESPITATPQNYTSAPKVFYSDGVKKCNFIVGNNDTGVWHIGSDTQVTTTSDEGFTVITTVYPDSVGKRNTAAALFNNQLFVARGKDSTKEVEIVVGPAEDLLGLFIGYSSTTVGTSPKRFTAHNNSLFLLCSNSTYPGSEILVTDHANVADSINWRTVWSNPTTVIFTLDSYNGELWVTGRDYNLGKVFIGKLINGVLLRVGEFPTETHMTYCTTIHNGCLYVSANNSGIYKIDSEGNVINTHHISQLFASHGSCMVSYQSLLYVWGTDGPGSSFLSVLEGDSWHTDSLLNSIYVNIGVVIDCMVSVSSSYNSWGSNDSRMILLLWNNPIDRNHAKLATWNGVSLNSHLSYIDSALGNLSSSGLAALDAVIASDTWTSVTGPTGLLNLLHLMDTRLATTQP